MKQSIVNFDSEVFIPMRMDMDYILFSTLKTMYEKNCNSATITIKLAIDLTEDHVPDGKEPRYAAEREIIVPKIEHKVSSAMQIKSERKGEIGGKGFELVQEDGKFILKPIGPEQMDIFGEEEDEE